MHILSAFLLLFWLTGCGSWWGSTPSEVIVGRGDTLYSISKRYNVQLREMIDINNLYPPYTLRVGQVLHLPAKTYHTIAKGDTLYSISRKYGTDIQTLAANNGLEAPYTLIVGQRLAIGGSSTQSTNYTNKPTYSAPKSTTAQRTNSKTSNSVATKSTTTKNTTVSKYRKTKFAWPVRGTVISKYGAIGKGRANNGINIKAVEGTAVKAADKGTIAYAGNELKGYGNLILVRHDDGWITAYAHNSKLLVKKGQRVAKNEKIATVGKTGGVNAPQLHFEIRAGKNPVNPVSYLQ